VAKKPSFLDLNPDSDDESTLGSDWNIAPGEIYISGKKANWKTTGESDDKSMLDLISTVEKVKVRNKHEVWPWSRAKIKISDPDPEMRDVKKIGRDPEGDVTYVAKRDWSNEEKLTLAKCHEANGESKTIETENENKDVSDNHPIINIPDRLDEAIEEVIDNGIAEFDIFSKYRILHYGRANLKNFIKEKFLEDNKEVNWFNRDYNWLVDFMGTCAQYIVMGELSEEIKLEAIGDDDPFDYSGDKWKEVNEEEKFYSEVVQTYTDKLCSNRPVIWLVWPFSVWLDFFEEIIHGTADTWVSPVFNSRLIGGSNDSKAR